MSKNFASIYNSSNDSISLEQRIYVKLETTRGTLEAPTATDLIDSLGGASVNFSQPVESSPSRSGRHHSQVIKKKTNTEFSIPMFVNINTALGGVSNAQIDQGFRTLLKSLFGKETDNSGSLEYTPDVAPDLTFSIFEVGDMWAKQAPGSFVQTGNLSLPGDGDAQMEFGGMSKTALLIGIGKTTTDNDSGNTITLQSGEGKRFEVGGLVQLIEADGTTRSGDVVDGSPRKITAISGDVITVDGAVLADCDGSTADIYLTYYEPDSPTSIRDPQTGLEGSVTIAGIGAGSCVRSATLNMNNNHEAIDYCFGEAGLAGPLYTPADRFSCEVTVEINLNHELVEFINNAKSFDGDVVSLILGDSAGRHLLIDLPKLITAIPEIPVPDSGSIPVTFTGNAYESALNAGDEVKFSFE